MGATGTDAVTRPRRSFRDVVLVAVMGAMLSLGVMGEVSGARTPDPDLYPVHSFDSIIKVSQIGCDSLRFALESPVPEYTMRARAQRAMLQAREQRLNCPD